MIGQNWFQNRRAKAKHEAKQAVRLLKLERSQSVGGSPEDYDFSEDFPQMFEDEQQPISDEQSSRSIMNSPAPADPCNPKYDDPAAASMQSLQRTELEGQAAYERGDFDFELVDQAEEDEFGGPLYNGMRNIDRAQFPQSSVSANMVHYEGRAFATRHPAMDTLDLQTIMMPISTSEDFSFELPSQASSDSTVATFPSQLLAEDQSQEISIFHSVSNGINDVAEVAEPALEDSAMRFMSPRPPADIASRRSKRRPAPIGTDALRDHSAPSVKTPLTVAPQRRTAKSPGTGIRRVSSVGAGLNVLGSRIIKSVAPPSQSPLRQHFPHELKKFAGMNSQVNLMQPSNSLAPPTPRSPNERAHFYVDEDTRHLSTASEHEHDLQRFSSNNSHGYFGQYDLGFSPPETPGHLGGGYHWAGYDIADNALHTPSFGSFPADPFALQMPQPIRIPQYVSASHGMESGPSHMYGPAIDMCNGQMQMSQQYLSPQNSELSVSPLSSCNNVAFANARFESCNRDIKPAVQYQWDRQGSEYGPSSAQSSPEQSRNQALIFHNATPRDFEGKASSGSP
jgi:hypothetical protein